MAMSVLDGGCSDRRLRRDETLQEG